jgi:hypothetical protein
MLHRLFHADSARQQIQAGQDFGLEATAVALDGPIRQQLGKLALGHHQFEQVGAIVVVAPVGSGVVEVAVLPKVFIRSTRHWAGC